MNPNKIPGTIPNWINGVEYALFGPNLYQAVAAQRSGDLSGCPLHGNRYRGRHQD